MIINDCIIQAYLNDDDMHTLSLQLPMEIKMPDRKRKDIITELNRQLHLQIEDFPTYNKTLWLQLFGKHTILKHIIVIPILGYGKHNVQIEENNYHIYVDLLYIADTTHIVSQMVYLMQSYLICEISRICIHETYPNVKNDFHAMIDYVCFSHGLSNYLSWGDDCKTYKFYTEKYEKYKEKAFALLSQTLAIEDKMIQHNILKFAVDMPFWDQFPGIAGMFYIDDIYRDQQMEGIHTFFKQGPTNVTKRIFFATNDYEGS